MKKEILIIGVLLLISIGFISCNQAVKEHNREYIQISVVNKASSNEREYSVREYISINDTVCYVHTYFVSNEEFKFAAPYEPIGKESTIHSKDISKFNWIKALCEDGIINLSFDKYAMLTQYLSVIDKVLENAQPPKLLNDSTFMYTNINKTYYDSFTSSYYLANKKLNSLEVSLTKTNLIKEAYFVFDSSSNVRFIFRYNKDTLKQVDITRFESDSNSVVVEDYSKIYSYKKISNFKYDEEEFRGFGNVENGAFIRSDIEGSLYELFQLFFNKNFMCPKNIESLIEFSESQSTKDSSFGIYFRKSLEYLSSKKDRLRIEKNYNTTLNDTIIKVLENNNVIAEVNYSLNNEPLDFHNDAAIIFRSAFFDLSGNLVLSDSLSTIIESYIKSINQPVIDLITEELNKDPLSISWERKVIIYEYKPNMLISMRGNKNLDITGDTIYKEVYLLLNRIAKEQQFSRIVTTHFIFQYSFSAVTN